MRTLLVLLFLTGIPSFAEAQQETSQRTSCGELRHVRVGYGSVGVVAMNAPIPGWVIGSVELRTRCELSGLRIEGVEILDASGDRVGTARGELELRVAPPDRANGDFSRHGTGDLEATVPSGQRRLLWVHARVDGDFDALLRRGPARYRLKLRMADGRRLTLEGALEGPWPTA